MLESLGDDEKEPEVHVKEGKDVKIIVVKLVGTFVVVLCKSLVAALSRNDCSALKYCLVIGILFATLALDHSFADSLYFSFITSTGVCFPAFVIVHLY